MGFELSNLFRSENLKLIFPHSILKSPVIVFLDSLHVLGTRCYFQCRDGLPWKSYAQKRGLPWEPVTTLEVATRPEDVKRVEKYYHWGLENGMGEDELEVLTSEEVRKLEPHVRGYGAIWSKTDTSVDYHAFTKSVRADAENEGIKFLTGIEVGSVKATGDSLEILPVRSGGEIIRARFLINCAGGSSLRIARMLGLGTEILRSKLQR